MKKAIIKSLVVLFALGSTHALAAKKKPTKKKKEAAEDEWEQPAYGMAGCGLGSLIIKDNGFVQVFASTTNNLYSNNMFGITTGTSNCTPGRSGMTAEQSVFVKANLASLQTEASQGEGETLRSFASLLGCEKESFAKFSQDNYSQLFNKSEPEAVLNNYKEMLAGQCVRTTT